MKLKNQLIKNLSESGLENTTDHELSAAHAYKVFRFRDEIAKAYKDIEEKRVKLVKDTLGEDYEEKRKNATEEEAKELDAKLAKFAELYNELMADETELNIKTIPFEEYHLLARENKATPVQIPTGETENGRPKMRQGYLDFFTVFRSALKDVLWVEPKEEE